MATRWTASGTSAVLDGKRVTVPGVTTHRLADGKIVEEWLYFD